MELKNAYVRVMKGQTKGGQEIENRIFRLIGHLGTNEFGSYITVDGEGHDDLRQGKNRIYLKPTDFEMVDQATGARMVQENAVEEDQRTDDDIARDLEETFEILGEMTEAVASGVVKGLVVSGPAGVGKSHTVEEKLEETVGVQSRLTGDGAGFEIFKGNLSAITLYMTLYRFSQEGNVVVLDDCDGILYDEEALNILKAALDSKKIRKIHWGTTTSILEKEGVPTSFEFKGGIIFLTNIDFANCKSPRIQNHLQAILSRCHYLHLNIATLRERIIHMTNVVRKTDMIADYHFSKADVTEVMNFIMENTNKLREITLRTFLKCCDLKKAMPTVWMRTAQRSLCK